MRRRVSSMRRNVAALVLTSICLGSALAQVAQALPVNDDTMWDWIVRCLRYLAGGWNGY